MVRLERAGYECMQAMNGEAGLDAARLHRPDAVILDIRMPGLTGHEVRQRLRAAPELCHIPIIFLSANVPSAYLNAGIDLGGDFYLTKPFESEDVIRAIELVMACPPTTSTMKEESDHALESRSPCAHH